MIGLEVFERVTGGKHGGQTGERGVQESLIQNLHITVGDDST